MPRNQPPFTGLLLASVSVLAIASTAGASKPVVMTQVSDAHDCSVDDDGAFAATDGGLVRLAWSGKRSRVWTSLDGIGGTRVRAIERVGSRLVVGTEAGIAHARVVGGGLEIEWLAPSKPVRDITTVDGTTYVATWGQGLLRLDTKSKRLVPIRFRGRKARGRDRVTAVVGHAGDLYAATAGAGIYRLKGGALESIGGSPRVVWSLAARKGKLYAGTLDGLAVVGETGLSIVADGDVRALATDGASLWVGTFGTGAFAYHGRLLRRGLPAKASLIQGIDRNTVGSCLATRDGVWLSRAATRDWTHATLADGPGSNDISAIARDGKRVWVGTFDQGLSVFENQRWVRVRHRLIDDKINALTVVGDSVWVATAAGLSRVRGDVVTRLGPRDGLPSRHVLSVGQTADGKVLVGTSQGAAVVSDGQVVALGRKQGVLVGNVWAVASDSDGFIWLGTTKGLYRGVVGGDWSRYSLSSKHLRDDWVMAIAISGRRAFVGSYKGGVTAFDWTAENPKTLAATRFGDGWINPGGLTIVGGELYAATMDGLRQTGVAGAAWKASLKGPGIDTTATLMTDGSLWVSTRRGLVRHPRAASNVKLPSTLAGR